MSNKKDHIYGVLGSGNINPKIVLDGLLDANENASMFFIHARRNPQGSVTTVYDFLADNEVPFTAFHRIDDNPPKALMALSAGQQTTDDPAKSMITSLKRSGGTLLLLWDDENQEASEKFAIMASDAGVPIKDLSDGLAPIVVEGSAPIEEVVKEEPKVEEEEELSTPFTRAELLNMNIGVLRRQAKALGLDSIGRVSKEEIVDLILGEGLPIVSSDVHVPSTSPALSGMLVYSDGGVLNTLPLSDELVAQLLGRG